MPLTNTGRDAICKALINDTPTFFNNANAYIGVGDSTTVFDVTQTDLQAVTNKTRKAMEATYPQRVGNQITFKGSFGTTDANYTWNEWGIFNASTGGEMLCRLVENKGSKNGGTWVITATITINIA